MITKELTHSEVDGISDEYLDELYNMIKRFTESRKNGKKQSFISKLKSVKIDAPDNFAANLALTFDRHFEQAGFQALLR